MTPKYNVKFQLVGQLICCPIFGHHEWDNITIYGCKPCDNNRELLKRLEQVVLVLDSALKEKYTLTEVQLRVNWHHYESLTEFDRLEVIDTNDYEVERWLTQLLNQSTPPQRAAYKQVTYTVHPTCTLSENTHCLLQEYFSQTATPL